MIKFVGVAILAVGFGAQAQAASFDCQKGAAKPATKIGAYSIKQVCHNTGRGENEASVSYPQIASPDAAAAKWNALVMKTANTVFDDQGVDDFDTSDISYAIGTASAKLISVHFDLYENTAGTAHPTIALADMNTIMPQGVPLKASDLFKVTPQWKAFMAKQLGAAFTKMAEMSLSDAGITNDTVTSQATNPKYWFIDTKGLTIQTGDLVQAPNSDIEAAISWAALKPYLVANSPAP
ncbi:MAG TPA: hypothetical protein VGG36_03790 [Rhizomicrobium sp.]|jgi:hypothetical protein